LGGDPVTLKVRKEEGAEPEVVGPLVLMDAPWSEQQQQKEAALPASLPLPEKEQGR